MDPGSWVSDLTFRVSDLGSRVSPMLLLIIINLFKIDDKKIYKQYIYYNSYKTNQCQLRTLKCQNQKKNKKKQQ